LADIGPSNSMAEANSLSAGGSAVKGKREFMQFDEIE
jgi:hypothetical protein